MREPTTRPQSTLPGAAEGTQARHSRSFAEKALLFSSFVYLAAIPLDSLTAFGGLSYTTALAGLAVVSWLLVVVGDGSASRARFDWRRSRPIWISIAALMTYWLLTFALPQAFGTSSREYVRMIALAAMVPVLARSFAMFKLVPLYGFLAISGILAVLTVLNLNGSDPVTVAALNENGEATLLVVACAWSVLLATLRSGRVRWWWGAVAAATLIGALGTGSRTSAIALVIAIPVALIVGLSVNRKSFGGWMAAPLLAALLFVTFTLARPLLPARLSSITTDVQNIDEWSNRSELWTGAWALRDQWMAHGVGLGTSRMFSGQYFHGGGAVLHNSFIEVAVQSGILGFLLFVAVGLATVVVARRGKNFAVVMVGLIAAFPFMVTLSAQYFKIIWLLPALAAGGIPLLMRRHSGPDEREAAQPVPNAPAARR